jgi:hypothetical protein
MDIKKLLLEPQVDLNARKITYYLLEHPKNFEHLMELYFGPDYRLTQRATLVIILCHSKQPALLEPFIEKMILNLKNPTATDSVIRNSVKILADLSIPRPLEGEIIAICFQFLTDYKTPIAIKVFSMSILERMTKIYPELIDELYYIIDQGMEMGSAGYKSRGSKILHRLKSKLRP